MNGNGILYIAIVTLRNSPMIQHIQAVEQATQNAIMSIGTFIRRRDLNKRHTTTPEVVLIDCDLLPRPQMWLQDVHHQWAAAEIVLITSDPRTYIAMIPHGATTLLDHTDPVQIYSETIRRTSAWRVRLTPTIATLILTKLVPQVSAQTLEPQEIDILGDIAQGIANADIVRLRQLHDDEAPERHMYNVVTKLHRFKRP